MSRSGTILIVTLWALVILTVFAISLGQQSSLEIHLAQYQRDKLRAKELARAAIERAIWEKRKDKNKGVDALSEPWANNRLAFDNFKLGEGIFQVSYSLDEATLYGMEDAESKINLNKVKKQVLQRLFEECGVEEAEELAHSILVWAGRINDPEEESNYKDFACKKEELKSIAELLLVPGMTAEILYGKDKDEVGVISREEEGVAQYLTVYGSGRVNINTAPEKVLRALIGGSFPEWDAEEVKVLVENILAYRRGDEKIGNDDDGWFIDGKSTVEGEHFRQLINLEEKSAPEPFTQLQWDRLRNLKDNNFLSVSSNTYNVYVQASVKKVKRTIQATLNFNSSQGIAYLFWQIR